MTDYDWIFKLIYDFPAPYNLCGGGSGMGKTDFANYFMEKGIEYEVVREFAGNI